MSLMSCLRALRKLQGYCERCCWVTAVLSTVKKERTFRRQECFTYSCWQVCTWGLLRSRSTGQDAGCGCRECGQCCSLLHCFRLMWRSSSNAPRITGSNDGGDCCVWWIFLPPIGTAQFCGSGGSNSARCKTARFERLQLSIDLRRHRMHCGFGIAVA